MQRRTEGAATGDSSLPGPSSITNSHVECASLQDRDISTFPQIGELIGYSHEWGTAATGTGSRKAVSEWQALLRRVKGVADNLVRSVFS
jgi:hypothetical protein